MKRNILLLIAVLCGLFSAEMVWAQGNTGENLTPVTSVENGKSYVLMYDTDGDQKGDLYLTYSPNLEDGYEKRQIILSEQLDQRTMWTLESNGNSTSEFKFVNYKMGTQLGVQQKTKNFVIDTSEGGSYYYTVMYDGSTKGFTLLSPAISWSAGTETGNRYYMSKSETDMKVTGRLGVKGATCPNAIETPDSHWILYDVTVIKASLDLRFDVAYADRIARGSKLGQYSASDEDWDSFIDKKGEAEEKAAMQSGITTEELKRVDQELMACIEKLKLNVPDGTNNAELKGYYRVKSGVTEKYINSTLNNNKITLTNGTSGHNSANTIVYCDGTCIYFPTAGKCIGNDAWNLDDDKKIKIAKSPRLEYLCSYTLRANNGSGSYLYAPDGDGVQMNRYSIDHDRNSWVFEPVEDLIIDDDLKIFKPLADTKVPNVIYTRAATYVKGIMSVCLPFEFTSEWPAYVFSRIEDNEAVLKRLENDVVPAGTPCFIQVGDATGNAWTPTPNKVDGMVEIASIAAPVFGRDAKDDATTEAVYGTFSDQLVKDFNLDGFNYKIASDGEHLSLATDKSYCFAFRAFLHVNQQLNATGMHISFEEDMESENAIESVAEVEHAGVWYNLQGQPAGAKDKGLRMCDNKKVLLK